MNPVAFSHKAQSRQLLTDDGIKLNFLLWPNLYSKQCVVFLHGFTNDAHIFDDASEALQQHFNVYALDFRGHGDSDWDPEAKYTHDQLQSDLIHFLQQLPFQHIHLVGHSLGARVAMLLLGRDEHIRQRCKSFTIIDTGPEVRAIGVNKVREDAENTPDNFSSIEAFRQYLPSYACSLLQ